MIVPPRARETWLAQHGQAVGDRIDRLPGLVADLMRRWACTADGPLRAGVGGAILPVRRADGTPAVLKMSVPHEAADVDPVRVRRWTQARATATSLRNRRDDTPTSDHGLHDWLAESLTH